MLVGTTEFVGALKRVSCGEQMRVLALTQQQDQVKKKETRRMWKEMFV